MKTHIALILICLSLLTPPLFGQTNAPADSNDMASQFQQAMTNFRALYNPPLPVPAGSSGLLVMLGDLRASGLADDNFDDRVQRLVKVSAMLDELPPIPESAREPFMRGQAIFKVAKDADDYRQAAVEFSYVCGIAPWSAKGWNNLAVSLEKEGHYVSALHCLKFYQLFKLSDADARAAQDLVYTIQAEKDMAEKHKKEKKDQELAAAKAKINAAVNNAPVATTTTTTTEAAKPNFEGTWDLTGGTYVISQDSSGNYTVADTFTGANWHTTEIKIDGSTITFSGEMDNGFKQQISYNLTLSDDGQKLTGTIWDYFYAGGFNRGKAHGETSPCEGIRKQ